MLPVYRHSMIDNLFCIFKYYVSHGYPKNLVLIVDPSLHPESSNISPYYEHVKIIWHEDFDDEE